MLQAEPIEWVQDDSSGESELSTVSAGARPLSPPDTQQGGESNEVCFNNRQGGVNPFLSMPDPETSVDYKRGYVMRKSCFDPNKKKTKLGNVSHDIISP